MQIEKRTTRAAAAQLTSADFVSDLSVYFKDHFSWSTNISLKNQSSVRWVTLQEKEQSLQQFVLHRQEEESLAA